MNIGERAMASACRMLNLSYGDWSDNRTLRGPYSDARKYAVSALDLMGIKRSSIAVMLEVSEVTIDTILAKVRVDPYLHEMGLRCYDGIFIDRETYRVVKELEVRYERMVDMYESTTATLQSVLDQQRK